MSARHGGRGRQAAEGHQSGSRGSTDQQGDGRVVPTPHAPVLQPQGQSRGMEAILRQRNAHGSSQLRRTAVAPETGLSVAALQNLSGSLAATSSGLNTRSGVGLHPAPNVPLSREAGHTSVQPRQAEQAEQCSMYSEEHRIEMLAQARMRELMAVQFPQSHWAYYGGASPYSQAWPGPIACHGMLPTLALSQGWSFGWKME